MQEQQTSYSTQNATIMASYNLSSYFDFSKIHDDDYVASKHLTKYVSQRHHNRIVLKYKKSEFNTCDEETKKLLGLFRSVICDNEGNVISFAPPKTTSYSAFRAMEGLDVKNLQFEEFVEGTMINVYCWNNEWWYATRSMLSGQGRFFNREKTFGELFCDIMIEHDIDLDKFDKKYVYSMVMQHKDNRIVKAFQHNLLYLTNKFEITQNDSGEWIVNEVSFTDSDEVVVNNTAILKPNIYGVESFEEAEYVFTSEEANAPYDLQGVVIHDKTTGIRTKLRNPKFEHVRKLRGNQPKDQYTYFELRKEGKVGEFLRYYPEFKSAFSKYRSQLHVFTDNLYQNYISVNVQKSKTLKGIPYEYRPHVYQLHNKFINELFHQKKHVSRQVVIEYMNNLETPRMMYSINYQDAQAALEEKIASTVEASTEEANIEA